MASSEKIDKKAYWKAYQKTYQKEYRKIPGSKAARRDAQRRYYLKNREKILANKKEYNSRPEIKEKARLYRQKPEVKASHNKNQIRFYHRNREKMNAYSNEYRNKPEVKEQRRLYAKKYYQLNKERLKERRKILRLSLDPSELKARDIVRKAYLKAYRQRPGAKVRHNSYMKAYRQKPEIKARYKAYHKEYWQKPEVKNRRNIRKALKSKLLKKPEDTFSVFKDPESPFLVGGFCQKNFEK